MNDRPAGAVQATVTLADDVAVAVTPVGAAGVVTTVVPAIVSVAPAQSA